MENEETGGVIFLENLGLGKMEDDTDLVTSDIKPEEKEKSTENLEKAIIESESGEKEPDFFDNIDYEEEEAEKPLFQVESEDEKKTEDASTILGDESVEQGEDVKEKDVITDAQLAYRRDLLKSLFGDEVETLIVPNEEGEDVEIPLDEFDLDEESFKEIIQNKIQSEKEAATQDMVSVKGNSDFTIQLLDLEKKGGDVRELLEYKAAYTDPLDNLDLSTKEGQRSAIALYLRGRQESEDEIQIRLDAYESKGLLEQKAKQFDSEIRESIDKLLDTRKKEAEQLTTEKKEKLKAYKKEFSEGLSKNFELNDKSKSKLVDIATKQNKEGKYEMDIYYQQLRSNPEEAAMLALWFTDREEFIRQLTSKKVKEEQLKTAQKIRISGKRKSTDIITDKKSTGDKDVILFDGL